MAIKMMPNFVRHYTCWTPFITSSLPNISHKTLIIDNQPPTRMDNGGSVRHSRCSDIKVFGQPRCTNNSFDYFFRFLI
jgi:hypothetical protein